MAGRAGEALEAVRKAAAIDDAYVGPREVFWRVNHVARCHLLHSYLAFGAGKADEAADAADRAAAVLEPLTEPTAIETWDLAALQGLWYLQGRRVAPGRPAQPPGRPEHAARALAMLRQAADRGDIRLPATVAFFGPVLGHMPEFQRLMMDLPFPADPFQPTPDSADTGPLPPAGANP